MICSIIILVLVIIIVICIVKKAKISHYSNTDSDISNITGVERDQCVDHYEPILPLESERCLVKFKSNHPNKKNIEKHNNGEICLSACTFHYTQRIEILYRMTKFASNFFSKHSVEWCFYYGGLVGLHTRRELLPWDPDIDIIINEHDINKLPSIYEDDIYSFNIHQVNGDEDIIGRIVDKRSGLYADITYYKVDGGAIFIKKMPTVNNPKKFLEIPTNKFYPLVQKSFKNGIIVPVPNDVAYNLEKRYGILKDDFKLVNNKYVKV